MMYDPLSTSFSLSSFPYDPCLSSFFPSFAHSSFFCNPSFSYRFFTSTSYFLPFFPHLSQSPCNPPYFIFFIFLFISYLVSCFSFFIIAFSFIHPFIIAELFLRVPSVPLFPHNSLLWLKRCSFFFHASSFSTAFFFILLF